MVFSAVPDQELSDKKQIELVVLIWKDIQMYVDRSEFGYGYTNDHHVDYIVENILKPFGIIDFDDYWVGVLGDHSGRPFSVMIIIKFGINNYQKVFKIKNVIEEKCKDSDECI